MSVYAMSWVFKNSEARLGARLVLIGLADYAQDDGSRAYPSIEKLAEKARLSPRQTQRALRDLESAGAIKLMGTSQRGTKVWQVVMTEAAAKLRGGDKLSGVTSTPDSRPDLSPDPSVDPSSNGVSARGRARLTISGKPVKPQPWELTVAVLTEFNLLTGKNLGALTGAGQPSESAKRVYLRVVEWPDLTFDQHKDIIRRTLASRWWGDDPPSVGVVYGPKVFEDNIARKVGERAQKKAARDERRQRDREAIDRLIGGGDAANDG